MVVFVCLQSSPYAMRTVAVAESSLACAPTREQKSDWTNYRPQRGITVDAGNDGGNGKRIKPAKVVYNGSVYKGGMYIS